MVRTSLKSLMLVVILSVAMLASSPAVAQTKAPPKLQAALILKLLAFYTNLGGDPFTIHVVGAPDVASELKGLIGKPAGKASLNGVTEGGIGAAGSAKVVYVGADVPGATAHTQASSVLSVTGEPSFVADGVTLGVGIENGKPKIILNLSSSKAENINWNPAILKVAATIK